jgi:cell division protein FtsI (penicillin-binding protein 3)
VANDGNLVKPHLVEKGVSAEGEIIQAHQSTPPHTIFSKSTAEKLKRYMVAVTQEGGTAPKARIDGIAVAGKTGTAEKVDPISGGYSREKNLTSFVGFAPAENPRFVALVMIDEPQGKRHGGTTAAPAWRKMMKAALAESGLHVELEPFSSAGITVEPQVEKPANASAEISREIPSDEALAGAVASNLIPDLRGLSPRRAVQWAEKAGLEIRIEGEGRVVAQELRVNVDDANGHHLVITLGGGR